MNNKSPTVDLSFFRRILQAEREEILNQSTSLLKSGDMEIVKVGDEADQARSEACVAESARIIERRAQLLQKIEYALVRIEDGTYFTCEHCEEPLTLTRLRARPVATMCVSCKEEQEARERAYA